MQNLRHSELTYLPGIGPRRAALLQAELGISTWHDLLYTFPYKHIDRSRLYRVSELTADMPFVHSFKQAAIAVIYRFNPRFCLFAT